MIPQMGITVDRNNHVPALMDLGHMHEEDL